MYNYLSEENLQAFISAAVKEDIGTGDHSSLAAIPATAENTAKLIIKEDGILAGIALAKKILYHFDSSLEITQYIDDGTQIEKGDIAFNVSGNARTILGAERLLLNCMQRMSGIATYTANLKKRIEGTKAQLLDTRKTTPNFRIAEKWAVQIGGGKNHRYGLFDMVMLKDNHIDFAGGIEAAINATVQYLKANNLNLKIEVETRNLAEVKEVIRVGKIDIIMLDNMPPNVIMEALKLINGQFETEASGGITEETILPIAQTGVDYISVGALTHSAPSMDMSLKATQLIR
jgi:nicotinate-nucleotide pyrophosphorylase (carboxylating)